MVGKEDSIEYAKAKAFFERGSKVAQSNNFDYAIEMYLEGIKCIPDAVEQGHIKLRQIALRRHVKGGKKPSMLEKVKLLKGKDPLEKMVNAEYLLSKDPDNLSYAEAFLKAAVEGGYDRAAKWVADLIFGANNASDKPSFNTYVLLKDSYKAINEFDRAVAACQHAVRLKPEAGDLADELKLLTAELTVSKGKYDQDGDFRKSIKNKEEQEKLHAQSASLKTESYRESALEQARKALQEAPDKDENIFKLSEALSDQQTDKGDNQAIELLEKAYETKRDFKFKKRAGEIRMRQIRRKLRQLNNLLDKTSEKNKIKEEIFKIKEILGKVELEHYKLCVQNEPTDLSMKYEYGLRLLRTGHYDAAIPLFQESQRDPRRKISAMSKIGLCFYMKGWYRDAIDIFEESIKLYDIKDDEISKELRYNLARSYEQQGDEDSALEIYRKIAQMDFGYKDVRQRVDSMRKKS